MRLMLELNIYVYVSEYVCMRVCSMYMRIYVRMQRQSRCFYYLCSTLNLKVFWTDGYLFVQHHRHKTGRIYWKRAYNWMQGPKFKPGIHCTRPLFAWSIVNLASSNDHSVRSTVHLILCPLVSGVGLGGARVKLLTSHIRSRRAAYILIEPEWWVLVIQSGPR